VTSPIALRVAGLDKVQQARVSQWLPSTRYNNQFNKLKLRGLIKYEIYT